jgi:hypothetical protein
MNCVFDYIDWRGDITFEESPFCEVDALVLSKLAYIQFDGIVSATSEDGISLRKAAELFFNKNAGKKISLGEIIPDEIVDLLRSCAESERFAGLSLSSFVSVNDGESVEQFAALTFSINDLFVVTFRGTDDTLVGWKEDFSMAFNSPIPAQYRAESYLSDVADRFDGEIILCGHSKGGNLAYFAALSASEGIRARIKDVYNLDGPGFLNSVFESRAYCELEGRMHTIVPACSVVGMFFNFDENCKVVESSEKGIMQHNGLSWHVLGAKFVEADGFTDEFKRINKVIGAWIDSMSKREREEFVGAVFGALESTKARTLTELAADKAAVIKAFSSLDDETKRALSTGLKLFIGESRVEISEMLAPQRKTTKTARTAPKAKRHVRGAGSKPTVAKATKKKSKSTKLTNNRRKSKTQEIVTAAKKQSLSTINKGKAIAKNGIAKIKKAYLRAVARGK